MISRVDAMRCELRLTILYLEMIFQTGTIIHEYLYIMDYREISTIDGYLRGINPMKLGMKVGTFD